MKENLLELSFSQANQWRLCRKSWCFSKVDKLGQIPSLPAIRGSRYHEAIEQGLKGEVPTEKSIVWALNLVEQTRGERQVTPEYYTEKITGQFKIRGYIDIFFGTENLLGDPTDNIVLDWKFGRMSSLYKGEPRNEYKDQLELYAYMVNAKTCMLVFPKDQQIFEWEATPKIGKRVYDSIIEVGYEIIESGYQEKSGFDVEGTPNWTCERYCSYRDRCIHGQKPER